MRSREERAESRTYFGGAAHRRRRRLARWVTSLAILTVAAVAGSETSGLDASTDLTMVVSGGDVALDSADAMPRWLNDSNIVALVDSMQQTTIAAARYQLQSWASDSTVNLALLLARDHAAMLISIDSVAATRRIVARRPAVADSLLAPYLPQITSLYGLWAAEREKRFLATQRDTHARAVADLTAFAGVVRDPDLSVVLTRALQLERDHLARLGVSAARQPRTAPAPGASGGDTTYRR